MIIEYEKKYSSKKNIRKKEVKNCRWEMEEWDNPFLFESNRFRPLYDSFVSA